MKQEPLDHLAFRDPAANLVYQDLLVQQDLLGLLEVPVLLVLKGPEEHLGLEVNQVNQVKRDRQDCVVNQV